MREIDDVEHAEDHGEPETEQRVERAVDQSHQKLGVESLHGLSLSRSICVAPSDRIAPAGRKAGRQSICYFFTSGQALSESGLNA